jgi:hypothetical protein
MAGQIKAIISRAPKGLCLRAEMRQSSRHMDFSRLDPCCPRLVVEKLNLKTARFDG